MLTIESLGFYAPGTGIAAAAAADGETAVEGDVPVNLSGGLKAKGHAVGATGVAKIVELTRLLRGDHSNSSAVSGVDIAAAYNTGRAVASAVVHVLEVNA